MNERNEILEARSFRKMWASSRTPTAITLLRVPAVHLVLGPHLKQIRSIRLGSATNSCACSELVHTSSITFPLPEVRCGEVAPVRSIAETPHADARSLYLNRPQTRTLWADPSLPRRAGPSRFQ